MFLRSIFAKSRGLQCCDDKVSQIRIELINYQTATWPYSRPETSTEGRAGDQRAEVSWRSPEAADMMQLPRTSSDHTFMLRSPVVAKILVNIGFLERNNQNI